jgi:hypothetical protein
MRGFDQSAQRFQIFRVLSEVFAFWCFQHFRNFMEMAIAHEVTESGQTNLSLANVFILVDGRRLLATGVGRKEAIGRIRL